MTKIIVLSVVLGIGVGYFLTPDFVLGYTGYVINIGLCLMLFFVGLDLGSAHSGSVFGQPLKNESIPVLKYSDNSVILTSSSAFSAICVIVIIHSKISGYSACISAHTMTIKCIIS